MTFKDLGLTDPLLKAIGDKNYANPSPIQEKSIPLILQGCDILASAQTGTGKTAGFAIPMIQILTKSNNSGHKKIRALILTPTRELAAQVLEDVQSYSKYVNIKSTVIFGGVNQNPQVLALKQGVDILVATPGRLMDLQQQGHLSLKNLEFMVLDEADRMLDMGFLRDIKKIIQMMPQKRQNLLFSATFSRDIKKLANGLLTAPKIVEATPENSTAERIDQAVYRVDAKRKTALVTKLIWEGNWHQVLIFTRTKHGANRLAQKLEKAKITAAAIHGNKSQSARTKALANFKSGEVSVLVATDIAARGLDIPLLPYVINYELPNVPEDYVHRIGRTGRAGASGIAMSLVCSEEQEYLTSIEKLLGIQIQSGVVEGFEPTRGPVKGGKKRMKQYASGSSNTNHNKKSNNKRYHSFKRKSKKSNK